MLTWRGLKEVLMLVNRFTLGCNLIGSQLLQFVEHLNSLLASMGHFLFFTRWGKLGSMCLNLKLSWVLHLLWFPNCHQWILTMSYSHNRSRSLIVEPGQRTTELVWSFLSVGKSFTIWKTPFHTLWARCFKMGEVMSHGAWSLWKS